MEQGDPERKISYITNKYCVDVDFPYCLPNVFVETTVPLNKRLLLSLGYQIINSSWIF